MRVLIEQDNGAIVEVREIEGVQPDADTLVFFTQIAMRKEDLEALENRLSEKIGKTCVVLDHYIQQVVGV